MNLSLRGRLLTISAALIVAGAIASLVAIEISLRETLEANVEEDLGYLASAFAGVLQQTRGGATDPADLARAFTRDNRDVRITLIDKDGTVVLDTAVPADKLAALGNLKDRPEVAAALAGKRGTARRNSAAIGTRLDYVALPVAAPGAPAVVRVAMPLVRVQAVINRLRTLLAIIGVLGLVVALFMSDLATRQINVRLTAVVDSARALSQAVPRPLRSKVTGASTTSFTKLAAELNRLVKTIARDRDRVGAVLEGMQEGVLALDDEQRVVLANRAAVELLHIEDQPLGRPVEDVVDAPALLELLAGDAEEAVELVLPGAETRTVLTQLTRRGTRGTVVVMSDVTKLRRLEAVRRDFVANVSHELRTPVSVILSNAEALTDGAFDDKERGPRFADALRRNAERLSALINDLLDLARIESGTWEPELTDVNVLTLVEQVVGSLSVKAQKRRQEVRIDVPVDILVCADTGALEQIIVNLVENAIKYTPEEGRIAISASEADDVVTIDVADDGAGIAEKHRTRVFQRFYRVDKGRSKATGGTGLGLSIVRHLVLKMDGDVEALANEPQGARFRVKLPVA